ncbi:MAG: hypothetical protein JXB35_10495 [Anaerolineae bacterium]|nr:hypothetical protein [Anaerolineae bacterium]
MNPGESLYDAPNDLAQAYPECVHKPAHLLPPEERPNGATPLILDGTHTYKIFSSVAYGAQLSQEVGNLAPGDDYRLKVPVNCHRQRPGDDPYAAEIGVWINGQGRWLNLDELPDRQWVYPVVVGKIDEAGQVEVVIRAKSKSGGFDFFIDFLQDELLPAPDPVDYVVTVHLLPQDATGEEMLQVAQEAFAKRNTLLYSADDAARLVAPGLPGSAVHVWWPERWTSGDIVAWLQGKGVDKVVWRPEAPPEPPPTLSAKEFVGLHVQRACGSGGDLERALLDYHRERPPQAVKVLNDTGYAELLAAEGFEGNTVYRHVLSVAWQQNLLSMPKRQAVEWFYAQQAANLERFPFDFVGGLNEISGAGELEAFVAFEVEWIRYLADRGIKATVGAWSVGNPDLALIPHVAVLAAAAEAYGAVMDYHWYVPQSPWCPFDQVAPGTTKTWYEIFWPDYHGRWARMDEILVQEYGIRVDWCFGEYGAVAIDQMSRHMDPGAGWRHQDCLNADVERLIALMQRDVAQLQTTRAFQEGRVKWANFFTINVDDDWPFFQLHPVDLQRLRQTL